MLDEARTNYQRASRELASRPVPIVVAARAATASLDIASRHDRTTTPPRLPAQPTSKAVAVPALALLAPASILEGYQWLHVVPSGRSDLSAPIFVALALPAVFMLTQSDPQAAPSTTRRLMVAASISLVIATVLALLWHGPGTSKLLGISDLLLGATALGTVLVSGLPYLGARDPAVESDAHQELVWPATRA